MKPLIKRGLGIVVGAIAAILMMAPAELQAQCPCGPGEYGVRNLTTNPGPAEVKVVWGFNVEFEIQMVDPGTFACFTIPPGKMLLWININDIPYELNYWGGPRPNDTYVTTLVAVSPFCAQFF